MPATLIDGKILAGAIRRQVAHDAAALLQIGLGIHLTAVLVGQSPAARVYADNQARTCHDLGIRYSLIEFAADITQSQLNAELARLAADTTVTGIMVHLPLPAHLNTQETQYAIDVLKDVEGVNPANIGHVVYGHTIIAPCTALAAVELIESTNVPLRGAEVTVVGASRIAGKPIALLLTERQATVTLCHIHTRDLFIHSQKADVLVVAVGKPGLITARHIKPGAVVIDVGINRVTTANAEGHPVEKTVGDVDFQSVLPVAGWITPVPGGVGPMTVAMLLKNTLRAARLVHKLEKPF